jgi:hypothetical protein
MSPAAADATSGRERAENRSGITSENRSTERGDPSGLTSDAEKNKNLSIRSDHSGLFSL